MIITERANSNNKLKSYVIKEKTLNIEQMLLARLYTI